MGDLLEPGQWEDPVLGRALAHDGSIGRGASAWVPVVEWVGTNAAAGLLGALADRTATRMVAWLRNRMKDRRESATPILVSRGMAGRLAGEHVAGTFGDDGPLIVEAVEEPSAVMGAPVTETSYVGVEPWLVLLRNEERRIRYFVVVGPGGDIMAAAKTPFVEHEDYYLRAPGS